MHPLRHIQTLFTPCIAFLVVSCSPSTPPAPQETKPSQPTVVQETSASIQTTPPSSQTTKRPETTATRVSQTSLKPETSAQKEPPEPAKDPCPEGMLYVDTDFCTDVEQTCIAKGAHDRSNHPSICAEIGRDRPCIGEMRHLRFCIDRYEFPNQRGAHPPVMVSAYDATAICHKQGKRLCWSAEWTAACEGRAKTPFPYGYRRDSSKCRSDQKWIKPDSSKMISKVARRHDAEMRRLDGSVPSGSMEECKSDFGVHDLTGNFDEWVYIETPAQKAKWAGLKGGWWGPLRNQCRPMTTNHPEGFLFYAVSFRCCKDPDPEALSEYTGTPPVWIPPKTPQTTTRFNDPIRWGWSPDYDEYKVFNKLYKKRK